MKLMSWNVNGIRAALNKDFLASMKKEDPDILCIQETKAHKEQVQLVMPGYSQFWNSADKKGYSGTLIFTKTEPLSVINDMGLPEHDKEGRVITAEFKDWFIVNVYTPNAQRGLARLKYRMQWDKEFLQYVKKLEKKKPVIFCGDLNVAHKEIDLANPKQNQKNAGFTQEERGGMDNILEAGFIDTFRDLYPNKKDAYTWWLYMFNARARNIGWRIDYFLISPTLKSKLKDAFIREKIMGSDHCPVGITLN